MFLISLFIDSFERGHENATIFFILLGQFELLGDDSFVYVEDCIDLVVTISTIFLQTLTKFCRDFISDAHLSVRLRFVKYVFDLDGSNKRLLLMVTVILRDGAAVSNDAIEYLI